MMSGYVSEGTTTAVLPVAKTGKTTDNKLKSGASLGQIIPTVPIGSFMAIAIVRDGGLCTAPSNLSAQAAYENMRSMLAATSLAA